MSDKASTFDFNRANAWERWKRKTIDASRKQLGGAIKMLQNPHELFLDALATKPFPYTLPAVADRRYHLINIARPSHDPKQPVAGWPGLVFDTDTVGAPFTVGPEYSKASFIHVFDSDTIEFLLSQLDTAPDLLEYLKSREAAIRGAKSLHFKERDLFATAVVAWRNGNSFTVTLPEADVDGRVIVPDTLWDDYVASEGATLTSNKYRASKNFDNFINHFHGEYAARRDLYVPRPSYDAHEAAMRIMASESRFSRRLIIDSFLNIYDEEDTKTFWASTVPSPDNADIRYVWLTYHRTPEGAELEVYEDFILKHLRHHLLVARLTFGPAIYVGIALPNRDAGMTSLFITVLDGHIWSDDYQEEAEHWKAKGVFEKLDAVHQLYTR